MTNPDPGGLAVRAAAFQIQAHRTRQAQLAAVIDAFENATDREAQVSSAGAVLALFAAADEGYRRRMQASRAFLLAPEAGEHG